MNKLYITILLLCIWGWTSSCKRQKIQSSLGETAITAPFEPINPDFILEKQQFTTPYLSVRSKLSVTGHLQNIDNATVNSRIKPDSAIWMSVSALGFEAVRTIITKDQIEVLDKFNKVHIQWTYERLSEKVGFPVTYGLVESILTGKIRFPLPQPLLASVSPSSDTSHLTVIKHPLGNLEWFSIINNENKQLVRMTASDPIKRTKVAIDYEQYQTFEELLMATLVNITILQPKKEGEKADKNSTIKIEHIRIEPSIEPLSFPFSAPINFKKVY